MDIRHELTRCAASHEVNGERRTADLLRRAKDEIVALREQVIELKSANKSLSTGSSK